LLKQPLPTLKTLGKDVSAQPPHGTRWLVSAERTDALRAKRKAATLAKSATTATANLIAAEPAMA